MFHLRSTLILTVLFLLCGSLACSATLRRTRTLLADGDIPGAAACARDDRLALQEVALVILEQGLSDEQTRQQAAIGLRSAGDLARPTLLRQVESSNEITATLAAEALAALGDRRMAEVLASRLDHPIAEVRVAAVRAVAPTTEEALFFRTHLNDVDSRVRLAALQGLARHQNQEWT